MSGPVARKLERVLSACSRDTSQSGAVAKTSCDWNICVNSLAARYIGDVENRCSARVQIAYNSPYEILGGVNRGGVIRLERFVAINVFDARITAPNVFEFRLQRQVRRLQIRFGEAAQNQPVLSGLSAQHWAVNYRVHRFSREPGLRHCRWPRDQYA